MTNRIASFLIVLSITTGIAFLLAGLIPGDASPFGVVKDLADSIVADGNFETMTLEAYERIRSIFWPAGTVLLAIAGLLSLLRRRNPRPEKWIRGLTWSLFAGFLLGSAAAAHLAIFRTGSFVYQFAITAAADPTPALTPVPTPTRELPALGLAWVEVITGVNKPVGIENAGDGSGRLFVIEKAGRIQIISNDRLVSVFLDISDRIIDANELEQGLLGLAFHPDFSTNGYFYVNYINQQGNTTVSRFQVSGTDPNRADPDSETPILGVIQPGPKHNGGTMLFDSNGLLYISLGDGTLANKPRTAHSLDTFLGKILRIDIDGGVPYSIPPDNPFVDKYGLDEIWAYGLRNPWSFTIDPDSGDMFIADVGHNRSEEINFLPSGYPGGADFGWSFLEGNQPFFDPIEMIELDEQANLDRRGFVMPIHVYAHGRDGCSVIGGRVYRGEVLPELQGVYLFGDYCSGLIWGIYQDGAGGWEVDLLFATESFITAFGTDENGEVYFTDFRGQIYRLTRAVR